MARVIQLSEQISNMIAAGEVVEGPLSVVKELVENSIDADSKRIEIYLKESGIQLIEIIDDGFGMEKDDALLSFSRHATSKIKTEGDLFRISSLGFRGEAIPSIASVSHFSMITKSNNGEGIKIKYEFGKKREEIDYKCDKGTKITIEKLFYNTPARLKYLKSPNSILSSIVDLITKMSIAHPTISFKLINDNNVMFQTRGQGDMVNLLANIYGVNVGKNITNRKQEVDGFKLNAYIAKPEFTRSRKSEITVIVNKRYVKSNLIIDAVVSAFRDYIPHLRYPICVINLDIDPLLIDVNVHPRKMEIKFSLEDTIYNLVKTTIQDSLQEKILIPEIKKEEKVGVYDTTLIDLVQTSTLPKSINYEESITKEINYKLEENSVDFNKEIEDEKTLNKDINDKLDLNCDDSKLEPSKQILPYMEYCGVVFGTYLIFQNNEGMFIIDQHAAQERIKYEYYFNIFSNPNKDSIDLLIPISMDFTISESILLEENLSKLELIGLIIEQSGPQSFLIRSIPLWIKSNEPEYIVEKIVSFLIEKKTFDIGLHRDAIAKMVSCKESIKANNHTTPEEAADLYAQLKLCVNPFTCPHGRPSIIKMTAYEIEKLFKRVI